MNVRHRNGFTFVFPFLSNQDKLCLRLVDHALKKQVTLNQDAPYESKIEFLIGIDDLFYDKRVFEDAWRLYHITLDSPSMMPSVLYKLATKPLLISQGVFQQVAQGENLVRTGRLYAPATNLHTWDTNQTWMLAQIHKGREFIILCPPQQKHLTRTHDPYTYSAFAREIATAFKAGYRVSDIEDGYTLLTPTNEIEDNRALSSRSLQVTNPEIRTSFRYIQNMHDANNTAEQLLNFIKNKITAAHHIIDDLCSDKTTSLLPMELLRGYSVTFADNCKPTINEFFNGKDTCAKRYLFNKLLSMLTDDMSPFKQYIPSNEMIHVLSPYEEVSTERVKILTETIVKIIQSKFLTYINASRENHYSSHAGYRY